MHKVQIIQSISHITKRMPGIKETFDSSDLLLMSPQLMYTVNTEKETVCSATFITLEQL